MTSHSPIKHHTVDLSSLLISTKGQSETKTSSKKNKIWSVETISGINWYYYLVPNENHYSLIESIGVSELKKKFIVCQTLPNDKNPKKPTRLFAAFNSLFEFVHCMINITPERWFFFEVILGEQVQKLYFDIDISRETLEKLNIIQPQMSTEQVQQTMDLFANGLLTSLVGRIVDTFSIRNHKIDIARQVLLFSSNSTEKRSYHVIIDGYAVANCKENNILANEVLDGFPSHYKECIDSSMYSVKQQLRLLYSQKPGSGRPKIFVDRWQYGHHIIEYPYHNVSAPDVNSLEAIKLNILFQAACVTYTERCQIIPILFETPIINHNLTGRPKFWSETGAFDDYDENLLTDEILTAICERIDSILFEIFKMDKTLGTLILLRRKRSAHCSLCDRVHDNENAFLRINTAGKVYFYCRRNPDKNKIVADVYDLLPVSKELEKEQYSSIIQQLYGKNNVPSAPSVQTVHNELRTVATQNNLIFTRKSSNLVTNYV